MKFFALILSLLLLLITVAPAPAGNMDDSSVACCADHCSSDTNNSSSDADCDFCHPFLGCACFSLTISQHQEISLTSEFRIGIHRNSIYIDLTPLQFHIAYWQPPKALA